MTDEAQRIAIAKFRGWTIGSEGYGWPGESIGEFKPLPDYLRSLDAIHEAESCLNIGDGDAPGSHYWSYQVALSVVTKAANQGGPLSIIRATAAQRAEALLKTIGKWQP